VISPKAGGKGFSGYDTENDISSGFRWRPDRMMDTSEYCAIVRRQIPRLVGTSVLKKRWFSDRTKHSRARMVAAYRQHASSTMQANLDPYGKSGGEPRDMQDRFRLHRHPTGAGMFVSRPFLECVYTLFASEIMRVSPNRILIGSF